MNERDCREKMAIAKRRDERLGLVVAGIVGLVILALALAFRLGCASICESRGGRVVWTSGGEVVCVEPGR